MVEEEGEEYAIHGGRPVTAKTIDQLRDGAVVRFASRLLGGGKNKKKTVKKTASRLLGGGKNKESEQGMTEASSSEANAEAASGLIKKMTKLARWSNEGAERFRNMSKEQEKEFMERICSKLRTEVGAGTRICA